MKHCLSEITGGLGNQMFCYAAGYAAAKELRKQFVMDISELDNDTFGRAYALHDFKITASIASLSRKNTVAKALRKVKLTVFRTVSSQDQYEQLKQSAVNKPIYLTGNWHEQNYKLFHAYRTQIQKEFTFKSRLSAQYSRLLEELSQYHSVAIHLRYGDYVKIGCCLDTSFYRKAIEQLSETLAMESKTVRLVIFSENINTARSIIDAADKRFEKIYITRERKLSDVEEFMLMQNCDDHIISNSTFSWWAAYLHDGGTVIAPVIRNWIKNEWEEDYFPEYWITIEMALMDMLGVNEST